MREYITSAFPELKKIKDDDLREKIVELWICAMEKGGWQSLEQIPFTLLIPDVKTSLVEHTRRVTNMAMAIADKRDDVDKDLIIAGAIAHDVGKLLEYELKEEKVRKSEYGRLVRHPISGACLAHQMNLPKEIVHIIAAHSKEGEAVKRSREAIIINHCDFIDFEIAKAKK
jgi:putative nucleotidyltransferase with HDIG domain